MKTKHLLLTALLCSTCTFAFADMVPANAVPMETVLQNLEKAGYTAVQKVTFDDGFYEAKAVNASGVSTEIKLNPAGTIVTPTSNSGGVSMMDAVKAVEAAGYHGISKIELKKEAFQIEALDNQNNKIDLKVDAITGAVTKASWFN